MEKNAVKREEVEELLGFEITDKQYQKSEERARRKLSIIISRFGDAGGTRRKPEYLAELIYEDALADFFSKATIFVTDKRAVYGKRALCKLSECPSDG